MARRRRPLLLSLLLCGTATAAATARANVPLDDGLVAPAVAFAEKEVRALCESCAEDLQAAYRGVSIDALKVERAPMTSVDGTMLFVRARVTTDRPCVLEEDWESACSGAREEARELVVFQSADGSYLGLAIDQHPFLVDAPAWDAGLGKQEGGRAR